MDKPTKPCRCGGDWYWPEEYYGPKVWLCKRCHPAPRKINQEKA